MKRTIGWVGALALVLTAMTGCGGGGGGDSSPPPPPSQLGQVISTAAASAANDSATNTSSAFKVLQDNGVPAVVVVGGSQVVNFTVFSDGAVKQGLALSNISVAIAKLVPGANGEIDRWESYVSRTETATPGVGPGGSPVLASARQATTDPKPSSLANQLVYNADGYYTYKFSTNLTDPSKTGGVTFEPNRTHRIAIQLSYVDARGQTIKVNPYFDITFDAAGKSVPVTDPSKTRVMADVASCNGCHDKLALHGGGRVDVQYCVMCHNPGTVDANSGNVLTMQTMVHKIHAGKLLAAGGEDYTIWGYQNSKHSYAEVGFPQDLRNCAVCHSAANPATPQGDNWKTRASKDSCLTCHSSKTTSAFYTTHLPFAQALLGPTGKPTDIANKDCAGFHRAGVSLSPETVHWNQNEENAARYKMNIDSVSYDADKRLVTVSYNLSDPKNANARYNLVTSDCTGSGASVSCANTTRFGNLRFYVAYGNLVGQPANTTEFSSYNNGGSSANAFAYKGVNDGSNRYTITIPIPADTATAVAKGTARVVSIGQIKEAKLQAKALVQGDGQALQVERSRGRAWLEDVVAEIQRDRPAGQECPDHRFKGHRDEVAEFLRSRVAVGSGLPKRVGGRGHAQGDRLIHSLKHGAVGPEGQAQSGAVGQQRHTSGGWRQGHVLAGDQAPDATLAGHSFDDPQVTQGLLVPACPSLGQAAACACTTHRSALLPLVSLNAARLAHTLVHGFVGDLGAVAVGGHHSIQSYEEIHLGGCTRALMRAWLHGGHGLSPCAPSHRRGRSRSRRRAFPCALPRLGGW